MVRKRLSSKDKLMKMIPADEDVLWMGGPISTPYYVERIFESLAIPLAWMLITFYILNIYMSFDIPLIPAKTITIAMIVLNIPMIFWLCRTLTAGIALKNTFYIATDKALYFKNGANEFEVFKTEEERYEYKDIIEMWNHFGIVDRIYGVGDVYFKLMRNGKETKFYIIDVKGPVDLLQIIERAKEGGRS